MQSHADNVSSYAEWILELLFLLQVSLVERHRLPVMMGLLKLLFQFCWVTFHGVLTIKGLSFRWVASVELNSETADSEPILRCDLNLPQFPSKPSFPILVVIIPVNQNIVQDSPLSFAQRHCVLNESEQF